MPSRAKACRRPLGPVLAAALVLPSGCAGFGWRTLRVGHASLDGGPAALSGAGDATAVDLSWDAGLVASAGAIFPRDGDAAGYAGVGIDWGAVSSMGPHTERQWAIAYTYIGYWRWPEAPERHGLLTGIRLGVRVPDLGPGRRRLSLEASVDWKWLNDAAGDEDAEFGAVALGVALVGHW